MTVTTPARPSTAEDVERALACDDPGASTLAALLSPAASTYLEEMAQRALALTRRHFGRTVSLYTPLYLANHCSNGCEYCGFASDRPQRRHRLEPADMVREMDALNDLGFEDLLLLTGERTQLADVGFLRKGVLLAAERFHHVGVETFPMTTPEYARLADAGCSGVTIYQETYDPVLYDRFHRWGPKKDYRDRLEAPARAMAAEMRTVGLGVLLGLADPIPDALRLFQHASDLRKRYWRSGIALSFPRIRPEPGGFSPPFPVDKAMLARIVFAFRIVLPDVPLLLSTRELPAFRDAMAGLGITKMSAGSRTTVGGYSGEKPDDAGQFQVSDERGVPEFCAMLRERGLEPIFKNWDRIFQGAGNG